MTFLRYLRSSGHWIVETDGLDHMAILAPANFTVMDQLPPCFGALELSWNNVTGPGNIGIRPFLSHYLDERGRAASVPACGRPPLDHSPDLRLRSYQLRSLDLVTPLLLVNHTKKCLNTSDRQTLFFHPRSKDSPSFPIVPSASISCQQATPQLDNTIKT